MYKMGWRQGDAAPLSLVELLTFSRPKEKKKSTVTKAKEALKRVTPKGRGRKKKGEEKKATEEEKKE